MLGKARNARKKLSIIIFILITACTANQTVAVSTTATTIVPVQTEEMRLQQVTETAIPPSPTRSALDNIKLEACAGINATTEDEKSFVNVARAKIFDLAGTFNFIHECPNSEPGTEVTRESEYSILGSIDFLCNKEGVAGEIQYKRTLLVGSQEVSCETVQKRMPYNFQFSFDWGAKPLMVYIAADAAILNNEYLLVTGIGAPGFFGFNSGQATFFYNGMPMTYISESYFSDGEKKWYVTPAYVTLYRNDSHFDVFDCTGATLSAHDYRWRARNGTESFNYYRKIGKDFVKDGELGSPTILRYDNPDSDWSGYIIVYDETRTYFLDWDQVSCTP